MHALGGWKNVAIGLGVLMGVKLLAPVVSLTLGFAKFFALLAGGVPALSGIAAGVASVGLAIAGAAAAGGIIGHEIWKHLLEGTKAGDAAGSWVAHMLAALGDKTAQDAVNRMEHPDKSAGMKNYHPERTVWFKQRESQAMQFFTSHGWSKAQAAGIVGNLAQESTLNPNAVNKNGGAMGIAQWMGKRATEFQQIEGVPLKGASYEKQLDFVNWELHHTESRAGGVLQRATAPDSAALVFGQMDERFGNDGSLGKRIAYANDAFASAGPYTAGGGKGKDGKVHVEVSVKGLPPGTTAKVNTSGATNASARVAHSTTGAMS